jgi:chromosome segregation ATPase
MMEGKKTSVTPELQNYHETIFILSDEIIKLETQKSSLEKEIENREIFLAQYSQDTAKYEELVTTIKSKELILQDIIKSTEDAILKKNDIIVELQNLKKSVIEKQRITDGIELLKKQFNDLQTNIATLIDTHATKKSQFESAITDYKQQIKTLSENIISVIQ